MIGIYGIKNTTNCKIYVGQSTDIDKRFYNHNYDLRNNKHSNDHLQKSWNKYGDDRFEFLILEECDKTELNEKEYQWIKNHQPNVYNFECEILVGGKMSNETRHKMSLAAQGEKNSFFGKKHNKDSKKRMSEWKKANYVGENNPNYGKKCSKQTKLKMVERNSSTKLTVDQVLSIVEMLKAGQIHQTIADNFGISRTVITRISNGTRWANVTGGPVNPVQYKNGKRVFSEVHKQRIGQKRKEAWATKNTALEEK